MRLVFLLVVTTVFPFYAKAAQPVPDLPDKAILQLINLYSDGIAQSCPEFRCIKYGHFFDESSDDAIAMFSLEGFGGGNGHGEYIAFFQGVEPYEANGERTSPYRLIATMQIGGRWWRTFDWKSLSIAPGRARISGKIWRSEDPGCCPSAPFTTTFQLQEDRVVESD